MQRIDLAKIRSDHSVSQKDLAEKLGVKQSFLSNIERGRSPLPPEKLDKIIEIFDIENIDIYYIEDIGSSNMSKSQSDNTNSIINDSAIFEKFVGVKQRSLCRGDTGISRFQVYKVGSYGASSGM